MNNTLRSLYHRQLFFPGLLGIFINPFYFARKELCSEIGKFAPKLEGKVLDVGCGIKPYRELFSSASNYIGLEVDSSKNRLIKNADFFYDGVIFPFDQASFDNIVCNQVLEHVFTPDQFIKEIYRVLKPNGSLLLTVPFVWDEHEQPYDYARYSSFGLKSLLENNGFDIIEQRKTNADIRVLFQLVNAYLYKVLWTRRPLINLLICATVMAPLNILGSLFYRLWPANPDLYLDQVVLANKVIKK
jgi:SAM-dependent methyltransferase